MHRSARGQEFGIGCTYAVVRKLENVSLGQNVYVGNKVRIGDNCKVQNNVSVYDNVILEESVSGAGMVFTNVHNPRAHIERGKLLETRVKRNTWGRIAPLFVALKLVSLLLLERWSCDKECQTILSSGRRTSKANRMDE